MRDLMFWPLLVPVTRFREPGDKLGTRTSTGAGHRMVGARAPVATGSILLLR